MKSTKTLYRRWRITRWAQSRWIRWIPILNSCLHPTLNCRLSSKFLYHLCKNLKEEQAFKILVSKIRERRLSPERSKMKRLPQGQQRLRVPSRNLNSKQYLRVSNRRKDQHWLIRSIIKEALLFQHTITTIMVIRHYNLNFRGINSRHSLKLSAISLKSSELLLRKEHMKISWRASSVMLKEFSIIMSSLL